MKKLLIHKSNISGTINAIPSKSYAHRILICAAFCKEPVVVDGIIPSKDMEATIGCLRSMGAVIEMVSEGKYRISPINRVKTAVLDCIESGSTLRFMLAVAAAWGGEYTFIGQGRLSERPNDELLSAIKSGGVAVEGQALPLTISGKLDATEYTIKGDVSSQYISGLLLAAPLIGKTVKINVVGELKSKSYVDITIDVMRTFGVSVAVEGQTYTIVGNQAYQSNGNVKVEGDWSNAAFPLAMGLLCGDVKIMGLNPNSIQGDMAVLDVIKRLGGSVKMENNAYIAQKSHLSGCAFDVENIIDAAPVLAVLCCFAEGESIITGIERLRIKESDRLSAIIEMINAIGGSASLFEGKLIIRGNKFLQGGVVDCKNDHRIVMSAVVAGGSCDNVTILGSDAVNKSYPSFFKDYLAIGGAFDVI